MRRRLLAVADGPVTFPDVMAHLGKERDEDGLPFHELIDAARVTVTLSPSEVRLIVDRLRELGSRQALGPTAVIVGNDVSYGVLRMLETLVEDVCDVRPFRSRTEAEEWLDEVVPRRPAKED